MSLGWSSGYWCDDMWILMKKIVPEFKSRQSRFEVLDKEGKIANE